MTRKFIVSVVVVFLLTQLIGFLVHGMALAESYAQLPQIMRTEEDQMGLFHFMILAHLILAIGITWLYRMGQPYTGLWWQQGLKFGLGVAMVSAIPLFMIYYVVQQTPGELAIQQVTYETVGLVLVGLVTAFINR